MKPSELISFNCLTLKLKLKNIVCSYLISCVERDEAFLLDRNFFKKSKNPLFAYLRGDIHIEIKVTIKRFYLLQGRTIN